MDWFAIFFAFFLVMAGVVCWKLFLTGETVGAVKGFLFDLRAARLVVKRPVVRPGKKVVVELHFRSTLLAFQTRMSARDALKLADLIDKAAR